MSLVDWCLHRYVKDWCLLLCWFLAVGCGVSSRLMSANICKSRLVHTKICANGD